MNPEDNNNIELEALLLQNKEHSENQEEQLDTLIVQSEKNKTELSGVIRETGEEISKSVEKSAEKSFSSVAQLSEVLGDVFKQISMMKGDKGEKGDKPVAGVDYEIPKDGKTPVKGEDYFTKEEVSEFLEKATPKKNKDYFDGKDGRDGKDADEKSIIQKVLAKIRQPKNGKDGRDGKDGKDGSPDTGKEIVKKLESLEEKDKLSYSAIKDAPDYLSMMKRVSSKDYAFLELTDTPESYSGQAGKTLAVNGAGTGLEFVTNVATDEKVGVSATDTTPDYLGAKVSAGTGITLATLNGGANELLQINVTLSAFSTDDLSEGSNLYFTDERAQDAVGSILTDTSTIDFTYNDAGNLITADVIEGGLTLNNIGGTLGVSKGGTGTSTTFTQGSVVFAGASGVYTQDNSNFFFDDTNNRLGVGINTSLDAKFHGVIGSSTEKGLRLKGASSQTADYIYVENSSGTNLFSVGVPSIAANGAKVISRTPYFSTYVSFEARTATVSGSPFAGFPRARFEIGASSITNAGLTVLPSVNNKDVFIEVSSYNDQEDVNCHRMFMKTFNNGIGSIYTNYGPTSDGGAIYLATSPSTTTRYNIFLDTYANKNRVGIKMNTPTAWLHLAAGTATANTAPLKYTSGTVNTTPEAGASEYDGTNLYITDSSAKRQTLVQAAYAELYENSESSATTITCTSSGTYYGWVSATAGLTKYVTADTAHGTADRLTVGTGGDGVYKIEMQVSYSTTNNNVETHWAVHKNGTPLSNVIFERKFVNGSYISTGSVSGIVSLSANDYIDLRVSSDTAGEVISIKHANLVMTRISR